MGSRRHLTIGITVNLDNYENLRLEMSAEVEGEKETEELITSLDTVLARLGRGTPETAERVDNYRRRVFTLPKETPLPEPSVPASSPLATVVPSPPSAEAPAPPPPVTTSISAPTIPSPMASPPLPVVQVPEQPVTPALPPSPRAIPAVTHADVITPPPPLKAPAPPEKAQSSAPAPTPTRLTPPSPGEFSCERCGAPLTSVQRKLSRLFQNKDLCKKCLNQP